MSVVNIAGEEVQLPQDPEAFRHRLENQWAKQDPYRWKQLAILTLLGNGWQVPNIARALKLNKGHVYRIVNQARAGRAIRAGRIKRARRMQCKSNNTSAVRLTKFQQHVLLVLKAIGPASYDQVREHCRHPEAVKKAIYRLRYVGLADKKSDQLFDAVR